MTVKDSHDAEGVVSTGGTLGRRDFVPDADATAVARMRAAGAIVLGKTNTPELTLSFETDNLVYGRTNNPYDVSRTPGGSSGGAGAIIAAGGSPLDLGTDTGGSIRVPSAFCGIAGLKPTSGRVSRAGHIVPWGLGGMDALTTIGPMARRVEDLRLVLPIIAGPDGIDPFIHPVPLGDPDAVNTIRPACRLLRRQRNRIADRRSRGRPCAQPPPRSPTRALRSWKTCQTPISENLDANVTSILVADGGAGVRRLVAKAGTDRSSPGHDALRRTRRTASHVRVHRPVGAHGRLPQPDALVHGEATTPSCRPFAPGPRCLTARL